MKLTENQLRRIIRKTLSEANITDPDSLWDAFANAISDAIRNGISEAEIIDAFESALATVLDNQ